MSATTYGHQTMCRPLLVERTNELNVTTVLAPASGSAAAEMDKDEEEAEAAAPPPGNNALFLAGVPLPRELMIHILCFLIPAPPKEDGGGEEEGAAAVEGAASPPPRLEDGVRWVFLGAGLVCREWHLALTGGHTRPGGRGPPRCMELWRQLAFACGFWRPDDARPLPPSIDQDREDWRQFFIHEYQQNWTWSPTRQVGRLGPHLGQARFVLTENRKKATLNIHTTLSWENGYACAAVMTEQEISDTRNRIRIKVARTTGFFTLGVCTGGGPPEPDYRGSFSAFVAWDNEMISYDVTGQLTNRYHRASFGSGDEIEAHIEDTTLRYYVNGEEVGKTQLGALPQPWHFYWAANCKGSSARILRASER